MMSLRFLHLLSLILFIAGALACESNKLKQPNSSANPGQNVPSLPDAPQNDSGAIMGQQQPIQPQLPGPDSSAEMPQIDAQPNPDPLPKKNLGNGNLMFNAVTFSNMEHYRHATDASMMAVLRSGSEVVAAGDMTLEAAMRGEPVRAGGAYPVTRLNVALSHLVAETSAGSGRGTLSICPVSKANRDNGSFQCERVKQGGSAARPTYWSNKPVSYQVSGNQVTVNNKAGGNGDSVNFGLSFSHPITMAVVAGYAPQFADAASPLVIDINRNGKLDLLSLSDRANKAKFAITSEKTELKVGWVASADGLLVLDRNQNGLIDDSSELFGEHSHSLKKVDRWAFRNFENGFLALAQYDSKADGKIDAKDAIFAKLQVWQDSNADGKTQKAELKTLKQLGITSIALKAKETGKPNAYPKVAGNEVRFASSVDWKKGKSSQIADVWFAIDRGYKKMVAENNAPKKKGAK